MNLTVDDLLAEIGRLHMQVSVLSAEKAKAAEAVAETKPLELVATGDIKKNGSR